MHDFAKTAQEFSDAAGDGFGRLNQRFNPLPHLFCRVVFRGVSRQRKNPNLGIFFDKFTDNFGLMDRCIVKNQCQSFSCGMNAQLVEELLEN